MKRLRYFRKIILFVLLFLLPFNTRHIFNYESIKSFEFFRENITFFMCPFDIGMLLILSTLIWEKPKRILSKFSQNVSLYVSFFVLVLILLISSFFAHNQTIAFYNTIRAIEVIIFFFIAKEILSKNTRTFLQGAYAVFIAGIAQSLIALFQFIFQKSVGLFVLGESHIAPSILGVAKIEHAGEKLIRGYGTFSHPNILGAFLLLALICGVFLLIFNGEKSLFEKTKDTGLFFFIKKELRALKLENFSIWTSHIVIGLLLIVSGIFVTFSRNAWLGLVIVLIFTTSKWIIINRHLFPVFNQVFYGKNIPKEKVEISPDQKLLLRDTLFLGSLYVVLLLIFLSPFIADRICIKNCETASDAYQLRKDYLNTATKVIRDNPIWGVGPGNFVVKFDDYSHKKLQEWEKQPVHSIYFLTTSEIGIVGLIALIYFVIQNINYIIFKHSFGVLLATFFFMGIFDHFFTSTFQGQLIFWLCLAFFASSCKIGNRNQKFDNF